MRTQLLLLIMMMMMMMYIVIISYHITAKPHVIGFIDHNMCCEFIILATVFV